MDLEIVLTVPVPVRVKHVHPDVQRLNLHADGMVGVRISPDPGQIHCHKSLAVTAVHRWDGGDGCRAVQLARGRRWRPGSSGTTLRREDGA